MTSPGHRIFAKTRSSCVRLDPRSSDFLRGNLDTGTRGQGRELQEHGERPRATRDWKGPPAGTHAACPGRLPPPPARHHGHGQEAKAAGLAMGSWPLHSKLWLCWRTGKKGPSAGTSALTPAVSGPDPKLGSGLSTLPLPPTHSWAAAVAPRPPTPHFPRDPGLTPPQLARLGSPCPQI